jgi:uncharacterized membrane protein YeaQ/YmgE (transglycosylase-associated protein family)
LSITVGLVVGAAIGWMTSLITNASGREALIRNVAVGIAGALVGGWLLARLASTSAAGLSFGAVTASLLGAAAMLLVVHRLSRA